MGIPKEHRFGGFSKFSFPRNGGVEVGLVVGGGVLISSARARDSDPQATNPNQTAGYLKLFSLQPTTKNEQNKQTKT